MLLPAGTCPVLEKIDDLDQLVLDLVDAGQVLKGRSRSFPRWRHSGGRGSGPGRTLRRPWRAARELSHRKPPISSSLGPNASSTRAGTAK